MSGNSSDLRLHRNEQLHYRQPQRDSNHLNRIKRRIGTPRFHTAQICAEKTTSLGKHLLRIPLLQPELAHAGSEFDGEGQGFHALECAFRALIHTHTNSYIKQKSNMLRIKRAVSSELRDEIFSLRYRAYLSEGAIEVSENQRFEDDYDQQPNHILWALTEHEQVVGSIRTTWFDPAAEHLLIPEMAGYADEVSRTVPPSAKILSGNRFVTEPNRQERNSL